MPKSEGEHMRESLSLVIALVFSLSLMGTPVVSAEDKALPPGIKKQESIPGKGSHKGWEKGKHKGWTKKEAAEDGASKEHKKKEKDLKEKREGVARLANQEIEEQEDEKADKSSKKIEQERKKGENTQGKGRNK